MACAFWPRSSGSRRYPTPLVVMRDRLDDALAKVGLRRISQHETALIHDSIAFNWLAQGRNEFDRDTFREICRKEGLDMRRRRPPPDDLRHQVLQSPYRCLGGSV